MAFSLTSARRISPNANVSRLSKFSYRPTAHDHFLSTTTNLINLLWYKLSARQTYKTAKSIFNNRTFSFSFSPTVATPRTFFTALTGWTDFYPISDECTVKSPIEHKSSFAAGAPCSPPISWSLLHLRCKGALISAWFLHVTNMNKIVILLIRVAHKSFMDGWMS